VGHCASLGQMNGRFQILLVFACGIAAGLGILLVPRIAGDWRTVQIITLDDESHTAELRRLYGYIDVNFEILLDGEIVHRSADFSPDKANAFREQIAWDSGQNHLVFSVAGQRLFGCEIDGGAPLSPTDLKELKVSPRGLRELGYEGETQ